MMTILVTTGMMLLIVTTRIVMMVVLIIFMRMRWWWWRRRRRWWWWWWWWWITTMLTMTKTLMTWDRVEKSVCVFVSEGMGGDSEHVCLHQPHGAAWGPGALARLLAAEHLASSLGHHLRHQPQTPQGNVMWSSNGCSSKACKRRSRNSSSGCSSTSSYSGSSHIWVYLCSHACVYKRMCFRSCVCLWRACDAVFQHLCAFVRMCSSTYISLCKVFLAEASLNRWWSHCVDLGVRVADIARDTVLPIRPCLYVRSQKELVHPSYRTRVLKKVF